MAAQIEGEDMARSAVRTWKNRNSGKLTNRITVRVEHHLCLAEMVDALCSEYVRNVLVEELETLPERLSAKRVLEAVRAQYEYYGTNAVWTWSDDVPLESDDCRAWAERVIIAAFPEMAKNQ
ncbi:hypothetical protein [Streptomyces flavofungini]|uniref:hypothetical protein n=1 Tax=Streptomyces flavofungini TaxID=68200 RepID=UPI0025AFDD10|nr:hypothetical protein [Streptomyces flavofungini]WJV49897.1 hypothetical protein QUY26_32870 [Streptomyces flavofungini]